MIKTLCVRSSCFILAIAAGLSQAQEAPPASPAAPEAVAKATPADGHVIHVTAPHLIDGKVRGPFHHYCKIVSPEPFIECLSMRRKTAECEDKDENPHHFFSCD